MNLNLKEKVALVTGASQGLGYATALCLAHEGAFVSINSRSEENINRAAQSIRNITGTKLMALAGDAMEPQVAEVLVQKTVDHFGGLDILITNTGGPPPGNFENFSDMDWQSAIELCFLSHVRLIRAAIPHLRKSSSACVLTITSYSVKQPIPELILSNSIRSATIGLTKSLALELGAEGIRFNSILPAWIETGRVQSLMKNRAEKSGTSIEIEIQKQAANTPLGRMGTPEEFANAAVFLVSPAASYITGVMLTVDGGLYKGTY